MWTDESSHGHGGGHANQEVKIFSDEELASEVDPILSMADKNKDGYIDYAEFVHAQAEATKQDAEKHPVWAFWISSAFNCFQPVNVAGK